MQRRRALGLDANALLFPLSGTMHKRALSKKVGFDREGVKAVLPDRVY